MLRIQNPRYVQHTNQSNNTSELPCVNLMRIQNVHYLNMHQIDTRKLRNIIRLNRMLYVSWILNSEHHSLRKLWIVADLVVLDLRSKM